MINIRIELSEPKLLLVAPPDSEWGFYQFPFMWRGYDGNIYVSVNVGADSCAGRHEPPVTFASKDNGKTFDKLNPDVILSVNTAISLPDKRILSLGWERKISHYYTRKALMCEEEEISSVMPEKVDIKPVLGPFTDGYKVNEYCFYRYSDLPEKYRHFPLKVRSCIDALWKHYQAVLEDEELLLPCLVRAGWWDEKGAFEWKEFRHKIELPNPSDNGSGSLQCVLACPNGMLLWARACQHPELAQKYTIVVCYASKDGGFTWHRRSLIAPEKSDLTYGYTDELALTMTVTGDIICAIRTKQSNEFADSHHLALFMSRDNGANWTEQPHLSEFSVTPSLNRLENGYIGAVYGRPGVHVKATCDGIHWSESVPIVGPSEKQLMAMPTEQWWAIRHDISCSNTYSVITGPDSFLISYSDFRFPYNDGTLRKAIYVREVFITD